MLIIKKEVFSNNYLPEEIFYRDKEINSIRHAINSFFRGIKTHSYCYGLQGTGKTAVARFLNKKLKEEGRSSIYIDAKETSSKLSFLSELSRILGFPMPSRGISVDEFISRVKGRFPKLVVFLDEADSFKDKDFLYSIAKSDSLDIMFVFISNLPLVSFLSRFSSFTISVEFDRYTPSQLKHIIEERARIGLKHNSYNDEILGKIAGFAAKHKSNARAGIMLLFHSALIAEEKGKYEISMEDVEEAKSILLDDLISYDFSQLSEEKRRILEALINSQYLTIEEISKLIPSKTQRMVKNYVDELINQGYVSEEVVRIGKSLKKVYRIKLKV